MTHWIDEDAALDNGRLVSARQQQQTGWAMMVAAENLLTKAERRIASGDPGQSPTSSAASRDGSA